MKLIEIKRKEVNLFYLLTPSDQINCQKVNKIVCLHLTPISERKLN